MGGEGFSGKAPGVASRWTRDARDTEWFPLKPKLVGEFQYDHFSGGRFRHGTKFLRWRPDKKPEQCTMEQIKARQEGGLAAASFSVKHSRIPATNNEAELQLSCLAVSATPLQPKDK